MPTIEASATQAVAWLTAGVVIAFGVALLVATLLSRMLLGALAAASSAARALGRGEPPQPPRTSVLEVNALNDALHDAARLLTLEKSARGSAERERERLLENERTAREVAQDENVAKDRFLALLGHELRNPLAAIAGASDVLARGPQDTPTQQRFVALIQRQNRHLKRIVDDLLEVSRMLSGKIVLDANPLDLADCVRNCIESLRATDRASHYRWQVRTEPVWVCGDPVRLEQIVNNLVVNAMQFSPQNGEILVTVSTDASHAVLEVGDSGPGIAPELQARIFEPFVQGPPVAGRQSSGLGIGLSLVKQLVHLHDGEVSVCSSGAGAGSTFVVRFPRVTATHTSTAAATQAGALPLGASSACQVLLVDDNTDARETTAALMRSLGNAVLLVDDQDDVLELSRRLIAECGARVVTASSASDAFALLRDERFDLLLSDIGMPGMDGYKLIAEVRTALGLTAELLPAAAISAFPRDQDRTRALQAGYQAYIVKPVQPHLLVRTIAELASPHRCSPAQSSRQSTAVRQTR